MTTAPAQAILDAPPAPSLRSRVVAGSAWAVVAYGGRQFLRLASNLLLARLLFPEAFGLAALVNVVTQGLDMVSDFGIGPNIIQSRRGDDPAFLNTAWTVQVVRGFGLWACATALAWPVAALYAQPALAWLLLVAGFGAVIAGFNSTRLFTQNRNLALGRLTVVNLSAQASGIAVMIGWALARPSVWALVAGGLTGTVVRMVLSHAALPGVRNRFCRDRQAAQALVGFGKWVFLSTLIGFFALRADRLLLGAVVPVEMLGVFVVAVSVIEMARDLGNGVIESVMYPALAQRARSSPQALEEGLHTARRVVMPVALFSMVGVAVLSPPFFHILYDDRYADAAWMAQMLVPSAWFSLLAAAAGVGVLALGDARTLAISNALRLVLTAACCLLGFLGWGVSGFILGLAGGAFAGYAVIRASLSRHGVRLGHQDLAYSGGLVALAAAGAALSRAAPLLLVPVGWWAFQNVRGALRSRTGP